MKINAARWTLAKQIVAEMESRGESVDRDAFGHVKLDKVNVGAWFSKQFTKLIQLPASAQPHKPVGTLNFDAAAAPTNGRRNNQGLEGLAVSPDNKRLMALMQSALVQDTSGSQQQTRFNTRLYVYDIEAAKLENPVLIGEPGVGKTAIVEGLAGNLSGA